MHKSGGFCVLKPTKKAASTLLSPLIQQHDGNLYAILLGKSDYKSFVESYLYHLILL